MILWVEDSKRKPGDPKKLFAVPMTEQLKKILVPLRTRDRTVPPLTGAMNQRFNVVLKRAVGTTSHSLRVSFISRCHRAGLTEQQAMRLVNHSSTLVHRIYSRLRLDDAADKQTWADECALADVGNLFSVQKHRKFAAFRNPLSLRSHWAATHLSVMF